MHSANRPIVSTGKRRGDPRCAGSAAADPSQGRSSRGGFSRRTFLVGEVVVSVSRIKDLVETSLKTKRFEIRSTDRPNGELHKGSCRATAARIEASDCAGALGFARLLDWEASNQKVMIVFF